jgi:hypothetical protein
MKYLQESPKEILRDVQLETVERARSVVQVRSGKTRNSIRPGTVTARYATIKAGGASRYLERGTKPHKIRARNAGALFFPSQQALTARSGSRAKLRLTKRGAVTARTQRTHGNAAYVMVKEVNHPGQAATPFLVPAAEDAFRNVAPDGIIKAWNRGRNPSGIGRGRR